MAESKGTIELKGTTGSAIKVKAVTVNQKKTFPVSHTGYISLIKELESIATSYLTTEKNKKWL